MSLWQLLMLLWPLVIKAPQVFAQVEAFIAKRDFLGLIAYLESLILNPIPGVSPVHLQPVVDGLKALKL